MAHRVLFWKPKQGIDVWLPAASPLGESIRETVRSDKSSDHLSEFDTESFLAQIRHSFRGVETRETGALNWNDDLGNGFMAVRGSQHVEVCCFDLSDDDTERLFGIAETLGCDHYDWGN
jgi:hypothetical protein